ncbi:hypothetical protein [Chamaesiphon sp.]|uniref:hypothetical protein n=1 Tax=Chamaesiphon sp. TaxID=2814140 RepID=UPI003593C781
MSKFTPAILLGLLTVITSTQFNNPAQAATEVAPKNSNIFILGGQSLPDSAEILKGDLNVVEKENQYLASIGIELGTEMSQRPRTSSKNSSGGYSDSDVM